MELIPGVLGCTEEAYHMLMGLAGVLCAGLFWGAVFAAAFKR